MAVEYRHSTDYTWVTSSGQSHQNHTADLDAHNEEVD